MARTKGEVNKRQFMEALMAKVAPEELDDMLKSFGLTPEEAKPKIKASNKAKGYLNSVYKNINGAKVAIHKIMDLSKKEPIPDEVWYEIERELSSLAPDVYQASAIATNYKPRISRGGRPRKVQPQEQEAKQEPEQKSRRGRKPGQKNKPKVEAVATEEKPKRGGRKPGSKNKPKEAVEAKAEEMVGRKSSSRKQTSSTSQGYPPFSEWKERQKQSSRTAIPA